jgi:hypothetical protein
MDEQKNYYDQELKQFYFFDDPFYSKKKERIYLMIHFYILLGVQINHSKPRWNSNIKLIVALQNFINFTSYNV